MQRRDVVKRVDGTGAPYGQPREVVAISDHEPVVGPRTRDAIAHLDDGSWEFVWNLVIIGHPREGGAPCG